MKKLQLDVTKLRELTPTAAANVAGGGCTATACLSTGGKIVVFCPYTK